MNQNFPIAVIPAKAGIQFFVSPNGLDTGFRWRDDHKRSFREILLVDYSRFLILVVILLASKVTQAGIDYCPESFDLGPAPILASQDSVEGQKEIINEALKIYQDLETADPRAKKLLLDGTISLAIYDDPGSMQDAKNNKPFTRAKYKPKSQTIYMSTTHFFKERLELGDSIDPEELPYYQVLLSVVNLAHEAKHALNDINLKKLAYPEKTDLLALKEEEFSAWAEGLKVAAELSARYPDFFDLYNEITQKESGSMKLLHYFMTHGPEAIWNHLNTAYSNVPTLDKIKNRLPPNAYKLFKQYYSDESAKAQRDWEELSLLNEECGTNLIAPSHRYSE